MQLATLILDDVFHLRFGDDASHGRAHDRLELLSGAHSQPTAKRNGSRMRKRAKESTTSCFSLGFHDRLGRHVEIENPLVERDDRLHQRCFEIEAWFEIVRRTSPKRKTSAYCV